MTTIFDLNAAMERVEGDREFLTELAKTYLDEVTKLSSAMAQAMEQNDISTAAKKSHTIRGASSNFCAQAVYDTALAFEQLQPTDNAEAISETYAKLLREINSLNEALRAEFGF